MSADIFLAIRILLTASCYLFLGWAFYTIWRDLQQKGKSASSRQRISISLVRNNSEPAEFTKPIVSIGRDPVSDLILEDLTVSTQHARLVFHHNQWWIEDLGSTNGTYLNDERVEAPLVVTSGDQLRCGQIMVSVITGETEEGQIYG